MIQHMSIYLVMTLLIKKDGIRIGLDGKPLLGEAKLPPGAKKALKKLWEIILKAIL